METKKKVSIIGFRRFGKLLASILENDFDLVILEKDKTKRVGNYNFVDKISDVYTNIFAVFFCIPISTFESIIKVHKKYFSKDTVLIDVLSVKRHPKKIFKKYLSADIEAILTHPMFGPDSVRMKGLSGQPLIMDRFNAKRQTYDFWKNYFLNKELKIIELSAEDHDKKAARSQGVTHFIGRLLQKYKFSKTEIDTLGAIKLNEIMEQTCNDTWELFHNLQNYNPETKKMRLHIGKAYDSLYESLLPKRVDPKFTIYGIQGGKASFNELAIYDYFKKNNIKDYKIKYLYTTKKVLENLHQGNIDYGLFAIHNTLGGMVRETINTIPYYKFKIVEEFSIKIAHCLMKRKDIDIKEIHTIMAHDQVLKQCDSNLKKKYGSYKLVIGEGNYKDTATAAKGVAEGLLPKETFILGNKKIADLYNFDIVEEDLQDNQENYTTFLLVKRLS